MEAGVRLVAKGRVQGVGFRWFVVQNANKLGVVGYVKNLPNGDVEIEAEGERGQLEELIKYVKAGPRFGRVSDLSVEWKEYSGRYKSFEVAY